MSPSSCEPSRARLSGLLLASEEMLLRSCCTFWSAPWIWELYSLSAGAGKARWLLRFRGCLRFRSKHRLMCRPGC